MLKTEFTKDDIKSFLPEAKVGVLATINEDNLPHITLITSMQARNNTELMWGEFSHGRSKANVRNNPNTSFLIMTMDKKLWRGKTTWKESVTEGEEYELFNNMPMWRYNSYFGIHTIHFMDLIETTGKQSLPLLKIVSSILLTKILKIGSSKKNNKKIMNPWTEKLFNNITALKFLSYVNEEGFPELIPVLQCQAKNDSTLIFNTSAFKNDLKKIKPGSEVAVLALSLEMENVLVRGKIGKITGKCEIEIDWIYNSMPPICGQIYPEVKIEPVLEF
jgi:uncharacterized pyridoxamine 5'-phosphate oxidase family protein